jgi:uncharacterized protein (TIGR02246 family)
MNVLLLSAVFVSPLLFAPLPAAAQLSDADQIRELQTRQADAWNHRDAAAYASLFTDDGDIVNVLGWYWRNPAEIRSKLEAAFAFVFHDSTLTITDVQVRLLEPTIAVAHVWWAMEGAKAPPGAPAPPRHGVELQVLSKHSGRWLIASFQNTNSVPETPFPSAPAGAKP